MNKVGNNIKAENANWKFSGETVENFDEHVLKSVPLYSEGHTLVCNLSDYFIKSDSIVYELGTSTGELLLKLAKHNMHKPTAQFIGIDIEEDMIKLANKKKKEQGIPNVEFIVDDILHFTFGKIKSQSNILCLA